MTTINEEMSKAAFRRLLEIITDNNQVESENLDVKVSPKLLTLRRMSFESLMHNEKSFQKHINVAISLDELEQEVFAAVQDNIIENQDVELFLRLGASLDMMKRLFGLSKRRYTQLRRWLGIFEDDRANKPKFLSMEKECEILKYWSVFSEKDEIQRYALVSQATDTRLRDIEAIIDLDRKIRGQKEDDNEKQ